MWDGMRPLWLVGGVNRSLHLACAVYWWSWRAFKETNYQLPRTTQYEACLPKTSTGETGFMLSCTWQPLISLLKHSTTSNGQPRPSATTIWFLPLTRWVAFHPTTVQMEINATQGIRSHYGSTKPTAAPWRQGRSQSLKCRKTFTSWCGCLPKKIWLNVTSVTITYLDVQTFFLIQKW